MPISIQIIAKKERDAKLTHILVAHPRRVAWDPHALPGRVRETLRFGCPRSRHRRPP